MLLNGYFNFILFNLINHSNILAYIICKNNDNQSISIIKYYFRFCDPNWPMADYLCNLEYEDKILKKILSNKSHPRLIEKMAQARYKMWDIKRYVSFANQISCPMAFDIFMSLL